MMVPLYDCNHQVYTDNIFSSISMANKLKDRETLMIDTTRTNRRSWPKEMKGVKKLEKQITRGESISKIVDGVECIMWKDKRIVCIINNITPHPKRHSSETQQGRFSIVCTLPRERQTIQHYCTWEE